MGAEADTSWRLMKSVDGGEGINIGESVIESAHKRMCMYVHVAYQGCRP